MVEWYNQRLPCAGPGFDSRSIHFIFLLFLATAPMVAAIARSPRITVPLRLYFSTYSSLSGVNGGKKSSVR